MVTETSPDADSCGIVRLLRALLLAEFVLGVYWTITMASGASTSLLAIGLFLYIFGLFSIFVVVAAWAFRRYASARRVALLVVMQPVLFLFLPYALGELLGDRPIRGDADLLVALGVALAAVLLLAIAFPKQASAFCPKWFFRSRLFNRLLLALPVLLWVAATAVVLLAVYSAGGGFGLSQDQRGWIMAYLLLLLGGILVVTFVVSACISVFGYVGLHSAEDTNRRLHGFQALSIAFALPALTSSIGLATLLQS